MMELCTPHRGRQDGISALLGCDNPGHADGQTDTGPQGYCTELAGKGARIWGSHTLGLRLGASVRGCYMG